MKYLSGKIVAANRLYFRLYRVATANKVYPSNPAPPCITPKSMPKYNRTLKHSNKVHWTPKKYKAVQKMNRELQTLNHNSKLAQWSRLVEDCRNSSLSVTEWYRENGIPVSNYYYRQKPENLFQRCNSRSGRPNRYSYLSHFTAKLCSGFGSVLKRKHRGLP